METIKNPVNLFWLCMLLHLIADYTLQGCLANMKQRQWWRDQIIDFRHMNRDKSYEWQSRITQLYKNDYLAGLICHSIMWSILTFLPLMLVCTPGVFAAVVLANTTVHAVVDHMKANMHVINLNQDQLLHSLQIGLTVVMVCCL